MSSKKKPKPNLDAAGKEWNTAGCSPSDKKMLLQKFVRISQVEGDSIQCTTCLRRFPCTPDGLEKIDLHKTLRVPHCKECAVFVGLKNLPIFV